MHELGIISGVLESARVAAVDAHATKILSISISVGEMTEAIPDALEFAFDALKDLDPLTAEATLVLNMVKPKSECLECGEVFEHDRLHMFCPKCDSFATHLINGRELQIDSIEVDIPDEDEASSGNGDVKANSEEPSESLSPDNPEQRKDENANADRP